MPENFENPETKSELFIVKDDRIHEKSVVIEFNGNIIKGKQLIELDKNGNLVSIKISENFLKEMKLDADFLSQYTTKSSHGDSITTCEKAKHPGWCKAGCWGELVINAAIAVAAFT